MQWHTNFFDVERIPYAIVAILITVIIGMITGPIGGNAHPFLWQIYDKLFGSIGDRLDKKHRPPADLIFRGFMLTALALLASVILVKGLQLIILNPSYGSIAQTLVLTVCISTGALWYALIKLYFAMEKNGVVKGAYYAIARSSRANLNASDDYGITRMAMNLSVQVFDKGLIAPVIWYLIAGMSGAIIYVVLAALAWRFGKNGTSKGFGNAALALEKLMGFIPSILSGLLITLACLFTPTAKLHKGLIAWIGHKNRATYAQGSFPLSALAWGLNLSLGGPSQDLNGYAVKTPWVGPEGATAKNDHKNLRRAIYINVLAHILLIAILLGMYLWSGVLQGTELSLFNF